MRKYEKKEGEVKMQIEKTDFTAHLKELYTLLNETAQARGFSLHPFSYYEALCEELNTNPEYGALILGYLEGRKEPISAMILIYAGTKSYHLFSGNREEGYKNDVPTLMMYAAIQETKEQGLEQYNMGGVSAGDTPSLDNLSIFKGKFGGEVVTYEEPRDVVVSKWRYPIFRFLRLNVVTKIRQFFVKWGRQILIDFKETDDKT